jgi:hypothetical protein
MEGAGVRELLSLVQPAEYLDYGRSATPTIYHQRSKRSIVFNHCRSALLRRKGLSRIELYNTTIL